MANFRSASRQGNGPASAEEVNKAAKVADILRQKLETRWRDDGVLEGSFAIWGGSRKYSMQKGHYSDAHSDIDFAVFMNMLPGGARLDLGALASLGNAVKQTIEELGISGIVAVAYASDRRNIDFESASEHYLELRHGEGQIKITPLHFRVFPGFAQLLSWSSNAESILAGSEVIVGGKSDKKRVIGTLREFHTPNRLTTPEAKIEEVEKLFVDAYFRLLANPHVSYKQLARNCTEVVKVVAIGLGEAILLGSGMKTNGFETIVERKGVMPPKQQELISEMERIRREDASVPDRRPLDALLELAAAAINEVAVPKYLSALRRD